MTSQTLNVNCTICKRQYDGAQALVSRPAPDKGEGVSQYVLICPHCQTETHTYYYTADIERRQRLVRITAENMRKRQLEGNQIRAENASRRFRQAQADLRRAFDKLNPPKEAQNATQT